MSTPSPSDLVATIGRAIADSASPDDRRAGRAACMTLAAALGEPGEPMALPGAPAPTPTPAPRPHPLDLAMLQMRSFLERQQQPANVIDATSADAPPTPAPPQPPRVPTPRASSAPRALPPTPAPTFLRPLHIPLVPLPRKRSP